MAGQPRAPDGIAPGVQMGAQFPHLVGCAHEPVGEQATDMVPGQEERLSPGHDHDHITPSKLAGSGGPCALPAGGDSNSGAFRRTISTGAEASTPGNGPTVVQVQFTLWDGSGQNPRLDGFQGVEGGRGDLRCRRISRASEMLRKGMPR